MKSKKGAEMTIGTIIVIILALVVLVVLIYGFSTGWGNLWEKLLGYGGGTVNVQTVVDGCKVACTTGATYDYCTKKSRVIFDKNKDSARNKQEFTCKTLEYQGVGLPVCESVDCGSANANNPGKACADPALNGQWVKGAVCNPGTQIDITSNPILLASDKKDHPNENCCVTKLTACTGNIWVTSENCDSGYYDITFLLDASAKTGHENQKCCIL